MIILKICWWFIKICVIGALIVCILPIYLILLALFPKAANALMLLVIGVWDIKQ